MLKNTVPKGLTAEVLRTIATAVGTPAYVYDWEHIENQCRTLQKSLCDVDHLLCFAVKANSNLHILSRMFALGMGADVVSGGEYQRALRAGCPPQRIVFSGVGKLPAEIDAALKTGLFTFNVESIFEISLIAAAAKRAKVTAPICLRVNPNIDAKTNPYIATGLYETKFGIAESDMPAALALVKQYQSQLTFKGIACHIGSQITEAGPLQEAALRMRALAEQLRAEGWQVPVVNLGGGLGILYNDEKPLSLSEYGNIVKQVAQAGVKLVLEPGRVLVGNSGVLLTRVLGTKATPHKRFVIVDGAMTELIRPCLYEAYHDIVPLDAPSDSKNAKLTDVVGPVCETSDFLGKDRLLPEVKEGDYLVVCSAGAYGASMGSTYNSRPRPPEVLVEKGQAVMIRRREALEELWALETASPLAFK